MTDKADVAGAVVGGIFGGLFFITCIISAIKAVKDRKRIKILKAAKEEARRLARLSREAYDNISGSTVTGYESVSPCPHNSIEEHKNDRKDIPKFRDCNKEYKQVPRVTQNGKDFDGKVSNVHRSPESETTKSDKENFKLKNGNEHARNGSVQHIPYDIQRVSAEDYVSSSNQLKSESSASRKMLRRHSYEVAVETFSCLQKDTPRYAKGDTIIAIYKGNSSSIAYENKAFDPENIKYI